MTASPQLPLFSRASDFDGLEARRLRAASLFAAGNLKQADIARELRVSPVSVHRWHEAWRRGGSAALQKAGRAGRKPRLRRRELVRLNQALREGASAHGFLTDAWALSRVVRIIERITGEHYHRGHVWRILRDGVRCNLQRHSFDETGRVAVTHPGRWPT